VDEWTQSAPLVLESPTEGLGGWLIWSVELVTPFRASRFTLDIVEALLKIQLVSGIPGPHRGIPDATIAVNCKRCC